MGLLWKPSEFAGTYTNSHPVRHPICQNVLKLFQIAEPKRSGSVGCLPKLRRSEGRLAPCGMFIFSSSATKTFTSAQRTIFVAALDLINPAKFFPRRYICPPY